MKRILAMLLMILMLTGCAQKEPMAEQPAETKPAPVEQAQPAPEPKPQTEVPSTPKPAPEPAPEPEVEEQSEPEPAPEPMPEAEPETPAAPETDWCVLAQETYLAVTAGERFYVQVLEYDGDWTDLTVIRGENDWNVTNLEYGFQGFQWSPATAEEWVMLDGTDGNLLVLMADGENSIACRSGSDVVQVTRNGEIFYLRAVNPKEGEPYEWKLYGLLEGVAEDAMAHQVFDITVDGSLSADEAAWEIACQIAENHKLLPEWVKRGVVDMEATEAAVFDRYRGDPEQFCFDMSWRLQLPDEPLDIYWVAGAGASEPDEEGWRTYFAQALAEKDEDGNWHLVDRGTGGYTVNPEWPAEKPWLDWLVEVFCLTEGLTHDWIAPHQILSLPPDQMERLPAILDQLTEREVRELCAAMGYVLEESPGHYYTVDALRTLLGNYGDWLDV